MRIQNQVQSAVTTTTTAYKTKIKANKKHRLNIHSCKCMCVCACIWVCEKDSRSTLFINSVKYAHTPKKKKKKQEFQTNIKRNVEGEGEQAALPTCKSQSQSISHFVPPPVQNGSLPALLPLLLPLSRPLLLCYLKLKFSRIRMLALRFVVVVGWLVGYVACGRQTIRG